ncbi:unnamed protein product [Parnassius apollo]|uniref:(apollo) hypothetical protein n=1 Tax=Parnassius apollo TaxID=110799 RepID=A0A8S3YAJ1_PARAO|nr:unnamed protein product [Parnassius apollo]
MKTRKDKCQLAKEVARAVREEAAGGGARVACSPCARMTPAAAPLLRTARAAKGAQRVPHSKIGACVDPHNF